MRLHFAIISCLLFCTVLGCAPQKNAIPVDDDLITAPHQKLNDAALFFFEHGILRWRLDADYMERPLIDTGNTFAAPVRISVYDTLGKLSTRILSDSGTTDSGMNMFNLWGNVYIENEEGMIVRSEQLKWLKSRRRITSDTFVLVETAKGDVLRGKGLDAADDFSRFSFSADVSGRFPDFRQRMEEGDEDFFF